LFFSLVSLNRSDYFVWKGNKKELGNIIPNEAVFISLARIIKITLKLLLF